MATAATRTRRVSGHQGKREASSGRKPVSTSRTPPSNLWMNPLGLGSHRLLASEAKERYIGYPTKRSAAVGMAINGPA